jgi:hypothetical protein
LIFASLNSVDKELSGQFGPRYIHIVISNRWSGWTRW